MPKWNPKIAHLSLLLVVVIGAVGLLWAGSALTVARHIDTVDRAWREFVTDNSRPERLLNQLYAQIGYGGMIHDLKNYLLRGDEGYFLASSQGLAASKATVERLASHLRSTPARVSLDRIWTTLDHYEQQLDEVMALAGQDFTPEQLDARIKNDDASALAALDHLSDAVSGFDLAGAGPVGSTSRPVTRIALLNALQRVIGYGGMIHNFKNQVLRKDPSLGALAVQQASQALAILDQYRALDLSPIEAAALDRIEAMIDAYRQFAGMTAELAAQGRSAREIDALVKIDDIPALAAFADLDQELVRRAQELANAVSSRLAASAALSNATAIASAVTILFLLIATLLVTHRKIVRPLNELSAMMSRLADGDLGFEVPDTDANNEIGTIARTLQMARDSAAEGRRMQVELIAARDAADRSNKAKSAFIANMSHELRTPLNAVIGYSEMLVEEAEDLGHGDLVPDLQRIHAAGTHLLSLISDVLDLSKIEADKMDLYLEDVELRELLEGVITTARPLADKNRNGLSLSAPRELGLMHTDSTKLRQILLNLLSNAAKFTHEGRIALEVEPIESEPGQPGVRFRVTDTGVGMSEDQLDKIFDPFAQADASTTRKYGGTGLGLTISRRFAQMMQGDITVNSLPGAGATFCLDLPRRVLDPAADSDPAAASPVTAPAPTEEVQPLLKNGEQERPLVLVIDDDPAAQDLVGRRLEKLDYRVALAQGGEAGLRMAAELRPDAVLLDIMMPDLDGWTVLKRLKGDPETSDIPVIPCTMISDLNQAKALGAVDYLLKPFDSEQLQAVLARVAGPRRDHLHVLVIDDDQAARDLMCRAVRKRGWSADLAEDGLAGMKKLSSGQRPDIIVLDLMMPRMDGFQFLEALGDRADLADIPVVALTAKTLTRAESAWLAQRAREVFRKADLSVERVLEGILKTPSIQSTAPARTR